VQQGAFEREVNLYLHRLAEWIRSHEKFTWINLALAISPSPITALAGVGLAIVQLIFISKNRIPSSEKKIIMVSLILGSLNCVLSSIAIFFLAFKGLSFWHFFAPTWLLEWFKIFPGSGPLKYQFALTITFSHL
jgi:pilus assembly protein TadC